MWKCHKCDKPVFFAERKQSLGYDWHPECLRCEECGKRLNPGQHAEHKGIPYCHVPCYGALFGPQLFGHGTRVESHKSFGHKEFLKPVQMPPVPRGHLESKLKTFNQFYEGKSGAIRSREVNGRLVLEGPLRIHWGVRGVIHLKEDDDQRMRVVTVKKRTSCRYSNGVPLDIGHNCSEKDQNQSEDDNTEEKSIEVNKQEILPPEETVCLAKEAIPQSQSNNINSIDHTELASVQTMQVLALDSKISATLPSKLDNKQMEWDELDELLQVERKIDDSTKLYRTMPVSLPSQSSVESNNSDLHDNPIRDTVSQINSVEKNCLDDSDNISENVDSVDENTIKNPNILNELCINESIYQYDELTLKASTDFDIVKLLDKNELMPLDQDVLNRSSSEDTLKINSPIDPRKINDSLKLYGEIVRCVSHDKGFVNFADIDSCEDQPTIKVLKKDFASYNRTLSVDDTLTDHSKNEILSEYPLQRSVSGPESLKATDYEDSASDSETINYAHPVDDHIIVPGEGEVVIRCGKHNRSGSTAIRRRNGKRRQKAMLRRRCSINGHFYDRETSFFTPPHGSLMSVWVTSLVSTSEVINLILDKYKVDAHAQRFALFIVRDNGEQRRLKDEEYPLVTRVTLGPREDISKLFLMDADKTGEVSPEVAQFINLSSFECEAILRMYTAEENREMDRIKDRYSELKKRIKQRMEDLRVRL